MLRVALILSALFVSACSASSGGGGGGGLSYISGTACTATITAAQCGLNAGKPAVLKCTGGVWIVTNDCANGEICTVKNGSAGCGATATGADTVSSDDGAAFDAITQPTDVKSGGDAQKVTDVPVADVPVEDIPVIEDTFVPPDIAIDIAKDVFKDVQKDTGMPPATWGSCALTDTNCMQSCVSTNCVGAYTNCQNDTACNGLFQCNQGCGASPIQMPTETGTPIAQNPGETQVDYCYRICSTQAGPAGVGLDEAYIECVIGMCVDCNQSASSNITKAQCQGACGLENYCQNEYSACLNDASCLALYGCLALAADQTAQNACGSNASASAQSLFSAFNTCVTKNATKCVAP